MPITVEDGTGLATADSFVSVAGFKAYHEKRGTTLTQSDADIEAALVRAATYLSTAFKYLGTPVNGRSQALPFPMSGLTDRYGNEVPETIVPDEVVSAACEAGLAELTTPGAFAATVSPRDGTIKSQTDMVGPISQSITYFDRSNTDALLEAGKTRLSAIEDLLRPFIDPSFGGSSKFLLRS